MTTIPDGDAADGHHRLVAQPHRDEEEGPVAAAEAAAATLSTEAEPLGRLGRPMNRRSPFFVGMAGAAGVAVTVLVAELVVTARQTLVLIGLALFIAIGLEPAVSRLARRGVLRPVAVAGVVLTLLGAVGGFLSVAIPQVVAQATAFAMQIPDYLQAIQDRNTTLGALNQRFGVVEIIRNTLGAATGSGVTSNVLNGVLGAGEVVLGVLADTVVVTVLTIYFLADLPRIRRGLYRLVPRSRRPRVILIGDEVFAKVGSYVLGILVLSVIAGASSLVWMLLLGVSFPLLLAVMVMLLDVIPVVGTSVAGVVVTLVALSGSLGVGLATAGFFVAYRVVEDYVLTPRIIGRAVHVPALLTLIALLLGAVLLGVIGAVVAIPVAAAVLLVVREVLVPRLDST
ncbi:MULTISPECIES: AI-2E family transporter [unclassified Pseudonocardia]|uniref:AI-2E family transporter n=1 Tax=unclassified Pseudonocardia TaxID=2619320 RepID=UPI00096247F5|nr:MULTISPECIES: AI-2E family transporter [unclassified Pseudonocardia]MBN9099951.1 AI-2E family transporter [Pseudonocardia sp.]OJY48139.1 MAG: AI-2E family transporter [Pseudonocardia sp. 73-21]